MTRKQRNLAVLLGLLVFSLTLGAFYWVGVKPYLETQKAIQTAEFENATRRLELAEVFKQNQELKKFQQLSLPADQELAKREYDILLSKMLRDSGAKGFLVNYEPGLSKETRSVPLIDAAKKTSFAYKRLVYKIDIPKSDISSVTEFLRRFYTVPLLHEIKGIKLTKNNASLAEDKTPQKERTDITANITVEALILDNAVARKTLLPIPAAQGATLGGAAWVLLELSPKVNSKINPAPMEQLLSTGNRDYALLAAKDFFHGKLPEYPPYVAKKSDDKKEEAIPPKPDMRAGIKFGTLLRNTDSAVQVTDLRIYDLWNNDDYEIAITQTAEKFKAGVKKYYYTAKGRSKPERNDTLEITSPYMSNKNNFTVLAVDGDDLILSEIPPLIAAPMAGEKPAARSKGAKTALPAPEPLAALLGFGAVLAPRPAKYYRWELGKTLEEITELTKAEADKVIQRAHSRVLSDLESAATAAKVNK